MAGTESGHLYTLTEVSKRTKISMPTLQRYKKLYQSRIPSVGSGRSQRYPEEALEVFKQLKQENIGRRGRPRKSGAAAKKARAAKAPAKRGRRKKAAPAKRPARASGGKLLTLTEIARKTNISYPTLLRYVKSNLGELPHEGDGRKRRFKPEAVKVFKRLRAESGRGRKRTAVAKPVKKRRGRPPGRPKKAASAKARRGRPKKAASEVAMANRVKDLEKANKALERRLNQLERKLKKPVKVSLGL